MRRATLYIAAVLLMAGLLGAYLFWHPAPASQEQAAAVASAGKSSVHPLRPHRQPPAGQKEYYNSQYRFSLLYPGTLSVKEYNENGGAVTIVFQNIDTAQGFQIYVLPYQGSQVTEERFKKDEPSGVRQGVKDITIDGAVAQSFYSTNTALGATAEIWFIYPEQGRGVQQYLYEVTTLKPLAGWLSDIMQTWQFL